MSRIHEALRKAAEQEPGTADQRANDPDAAEPVEASSDTFPIEIAERRRARAATPTLQQSTSQTTRPAAAAGADAGSNRSLDDHLSLERVDAHYAGKVIIDQNISAVSREQYRRLAATLHHAQAADGIKVVMLTSAMMGEGKTLTSSNLALTLSESYEKQVLLIDADLRRPTLHKLFRIQASSGLTEGLMATSERKVPVHQITSRLAVLAAGRPTSDPIARLTSGRMRRLLDEARSSFDWIILDTPPVALLPDANLLTAMADAAIMVVRARSTPWDLVQRAVAAVGQDRVLGVVLNSATAEEGSDYYGYNYYAPQETPSRT